MLTPEFEAEINRVIDNCKNVLVHKAEEYASDRDRLHNFKLAAALKGETPRQALAGMMVKHTVSVYDMALYQTDFPREMWDEKIGDHINYLLLLAAIVKEERNS